MHHSRKRHDLLSSGLLNRKPMKYDVLNIKRTDKQSNLLVLPSTRKKQNPYMKRYLLGSVLSLLMITSVIAYAMNQPDPHPSQQMLATEEGKMDTLPNDAKKITLAKKTPEPSDPSKKQNKASDLKLSDKNSSSKKGSVESNLTSKLSTTTKAAGSGSATAKATNNPDSDLNAKPKTDSGKPTDNNTSFWSLVRGFFWTQR